ncbi:MAG TPA: helix-turn-helix transcriptional regulator [Gemmataceae bacterium]|nr:helix-turn-helix transcriptional regulator [Gemmataceae bacterium]
MQSFGDTLKSLREKKGLSQQELADLAGTSQKAISFWEMGKREPALSNLQKLCTALGVPCDVFIAPPATPASSGGGIKKPTARGRPGRKK